VRERGESHARILLGGSGPKYVGSRPWGDLTLTLGCRALAPRHAWRQDPPARRAPGGVYRARGKGGRRGGSAAPPGSPQHSPAVGTMPPQSLLLPLPGLCFPPMQPTPATRMSLDGNPIHLLPLCCCCFSSCFCCCSCRGVLASALASAINVVVIVTAVTLR
jgi:hypothetical protein